MTPFLKITPLLSRTRSSLGLALLCTLLLGGLQACAAVHVTNPSAERYPYLAMAPSEPPAPYFETIPEIEEPQLWIWRPGFWRYDGWDFDWVEGRVIPRPAPTAIWAPDHWEKRSYGWAFIRGTWR